jgi:hypothetical protein
MGRSVWIDPSNIKKTIDMLCKLLGDRLRVKGKRDGRKA